MLIARSRWPSHRSEVKSAATSRTRIPIVTSVLPIAAVATGDLSKAVNDFDCPDVLGHLVPELLLDAHAQRRAIGDRQRLPVKPVGEDRLWMTGADEIDAFLVPLVYRILAVEDDVARSRLDRRLVEYVRQLHARPLGDAAPAF